MRCWLSFVLLLSLLLALPSLGLGAAASRLLPTDEVSGWVLRETPRTFTTENLYEYIDGNADLFLAYGFTHAAVGDYVPTAGEGWISVDIYDMGAPLHAFGIYQAEKPEDVEPALREAFYGEHKDRLVFLDIITDQTENVWPMVQGGKGLTEMLLGAEDL